MLIMPRRMTEKEKVLQQYWAKALKKAIAAREKANALDERARQLYSELDIETIFLECGETLRGEVL